LTYLFIMGLCGSTENAIDGHGKWIDKQGEWIDEQGERWVEVPSDIQKKCLI
jgi:hypothetical protein